MPWPPGVIGSWLNLSTRRAGGAAARYRFDIPGTENRVVPAALFGAGLTGNGEFVGISFGEADPPLASDAVRQARFRDSTKSGFGVGPQLREPAKFGFVLRVDARTELFRVISANEPYRLSLTTGQYEWVRSIPSGRSFDLSMVDLTAFEPRYEAADKPLTRAFIDTDDEPAPAAPDERAVLHADSVEFLDRGWRFWSSDEDQRFGDRLFEGGGRCTVEELEESEALGDGGRVRGTVILTTAEQRRAATAHIDDGGLFGDRIELNEWWRDADTGKWVRVANRQVGRIVSYRYSNPVLSFEADSGHPQRTVSPWRWDEESQQFQRPTSADAFRRSTAGRISQPVPEAPFAGPSDVVFDGPTDAVTAEGAATPIYERPDDDNRVDYIRLDRFTEIDGVNVGESGGISYRVSSDNLAAIQLVSLARRPGAAADADIAYLGIRALRRGAHVLRVTVWRTDGTGTPSSYVWRFPVADPLPYTWNRANALFREGAFRSPNIATGGGDYTFRLGDLTIPTFGTDAARSGTTTAANFGDTTLRIIRITGQGETGYPAASKFTTLPALDPSGAGRSGLMQAIVAAESDTARTFEASVLVGVRPRTGDDKREDTALFVYEQGYVAPTEPSTPGPTGPVGPETPTEMPPPTERPPPVTPPPTPPPTTNTAPTVASAFPTGLSIARNGGTVVVQRAKRYFNDDAGYRNLTLFQEGDSRSTEVAIDNSGEGTITVTRTRSETSSSHQVRHSIRARDAGGLESPVNRLPVDLPMMAAPTPPPTPARTPVARRVVMTVGRGRTLAGSFSNIVASAGILARATSSGLFIEPPTTTGTFTVTADEGTRFAWTVRIAVVSAVSETRNAPGGSLTVAVNSLLSHATEFRRRVLGDVTVTGSSGDASFRVSMTGFSAGQEGWATVEIYSPALRRTVSRTLRFTYT